MPIYEYGCELCGEKFQFVSTIKENQRGNTKCPHCGKNIVRLQHRDSHALEQVVNQRAVESVNHFEKSRS